jgi:thiol-disulfide isomerase/thioredoxin
MKDIIAAGKNTVSDSKKFLENKKPIVVLYELQGCPHCTAIEKPWANAIHKLKANKEVRENMDCANAIYYYDKGVKPKAPKTRFDQLPEQLRGVSGFPTIHIIKQGVVVDEYNGDRTEDSIIEFVSSYVDKNKETKPKATTSTTSTKKAAKTTKTKNIKA